MKNTWVVSDWHLGHDRINHFIHSDGTKMRPWDNADEMDEALLTFHNELVKPGDYVYNLGDVWFSGGEEGDPEAMARSVNRFNGSKRLIPGNHDNIKMCVQSRAFKKILFWRQWKDEGLIFTHVPVHESSLQRNIGGHENPIWSPMANIHGHTHRHGSPAGPYISVCVELTDFKPVHLDDLIERAALLKEELSNERN